MWRQARRGERGQLVCQLLAALSRFRDDEREWLDQATRLRGADDGCLRDRRVRQQYPLDVGGRDPLPRDLEGVVGAPVVMIEAVGVACEQVAGSEPAVNERAPRVIGVIPVSGAR